MRRIIPALPAIGVNRRWLRSIRLWLVAGAIICALVGFWAFRAFQAGPLLFPPPAATTDYGMAESPADWPAIRRDLGSGGWSPGAAPAPPFAVSWERSTPGVMLAPPAVVGDRVYITTEDGVAAALDAATGETVWSYQIGAPSDSTPAVTADAIYVGGRDHRLLAWARGWPAALAAQPGEHRAGFGDCHGWHRVHRLHQRAAGGAGRRHRRHPLVCPHQRLGGRTSGVGWPGGGRGVPGRAVRHL